jgi:hypothetical protein
MQLSYEAILTMRITSVKGLVQCHSLSVVCAPEHHHGSSQIQESRPLSSLCRPISIICRRLTYLIFQYKLQRRETQNLRTKNAFKTTL